MWWNILFVWGCLVVSATVFAFAACGAAGDADEWAGLK